MWSLNSKRLLKISSLWPERLTRCPHRVLLWNTEETFLLFSYERVLWWYYGSGNNTTELTALLWKGFLCLFHLTFILHTSLKCKLEASRNPVSFVYWPLHQSYNRHQTLSTKPYSHVENRHQRLTSDFLVFALSQHLLTWTSKQICLVLRIWSL